MALDLVTLIAVDARLRGKIAVNGDTGCWVWTGATTARCNGYGQVRRNGRRYVAHRYVYETMVGPVSTDLELDHLCRVPLCVNPSHLEPVTPRENVLRSDGVAAKRARQTTCHRGHPLTGSNLRIEPSGSRRCRECKRIAERRPA